jgi:exodeoxyribonuclease VII large subunit
MPRRARETHAPQADLFAVQAKPPRPYSVSEVVGLVRRELEARYGAILVQGELASLTVAGSGHAYFSLKDDRATLSAVMFRLALGRLSAGLPPEGSQVLVRGRLTVFEARGRFQLIVEELQTTGAGVLELRFRELKARLEAEGLFDPARRRPLPRLPECVGVVTSPSGAALHDILRVLARRNPAVRVLLSPTRVQGEGAAEEIALALDRLSVGPRCDLIIVGRGGGSAEDLWAFNEEAAVRAVARARVPVISAVGHEVDVVLTDLAADLRAPTPSAAAELAVPDRQRLAAMLREPLGDARRVLEQRLAEARRDLLLAGRRLSDPRLRLAAERLRLDESSRSLGASMQRHLARARRRLGDARLGLASLEPRARLVADRARLAALSARLGSAWSAGLDGRRLRLEGARAALEARGPLAVLTRGYSLVLTEAGRAVRDHAQVHPGERLRVRLMRGELQVEVIDVCPPEGETDA